MAKAKRPASPTPHQLDRYLFGNSWAHLLLILILGLAAAVRLWHVEQSPIPLALDPLYHMADSAALIETGQVTPGAGFDITEEPSSNPRLLSMAAAGGARAGIDLVTFYRYGGILLTLLTGVLLYLFLKRRFGAWVGIFGTSVFLFSPYVTHRTILTLPENLHLVLFLLALLILSRLIEASTIRPRIWLGLALVVTLTLDLLTHQTAFLTLTVVALTLICHLFARERGWIGGGLLLIGALFGILLAAAIPGSWGFGWPMASALATYLGWPIVAFGVAGLLIIFGALLMGKDRMWPITAGLILPLGALWLFYRGQAEFVGGIESERVYLYVALLMAFGAAAVMRLGLKYVRPHWLAILLSTGLLIWILLPRWSAPWPQVFHADEIEAVETLAELTQTTDLTYSQPIMSWLIRGLAHRRTLGNGFRQTPVNLRDATLAELQADAESRAVPRALIFFSKYQNDPDFPTRYSDGTLRATDFSDWLELPGIDQEKFSCLPILYENNGVVIYELPVRSVLPAACQSAS